MTRYPTYRDSGIPWLGEIPAHWETRKATWLFREVSDKNHPDELLLSSTQEGGVVPRDSLQNRVVMPTSEVVQYKLVQPGDFVISLRSFQGGIEFCEYRGLVSPAYTVLRAKVPIYQPYFKYLLKCKYLIGELNKSVTGIRQGKNIDYGDFRDTALPLPPSSEQHAVATYLDRKLAEIDALIAKKQRLIALLREQKAAIINRAVTHGLDPAAPLKPSGIPWLGDIPAHWEIWKVAHTFRVIGSGTTPPTAHPEYFGGDIPWVNTSELRDGAITGTSRYITETALQQFPTLRLYPPSTLLVALYGATIGKVGLLEIQATTNQACCALAEPTQLIAQYAFYMLISQRELLLSLAVGGGQPNISQETIRSLKVAVPPLPEQSAIADYLYSELNKMDELIARAEREIELMRELRTALIAEAVTGKMDVRASVEERVAEEARVCQ